MSQIWYARIMNSEVGPLTPNELREMAAKGQITPFDQIRKDGSSEWFPASRLTGLFEKSSIENEAGNTRTITPNAANKSPAFRTPTKASQTSPTIEARERNTNVETGATAKKNRSALVFGALASVIACQFIWMLLLTYKLGNTSLSFKSEKIEIMQKIKDFQDELDTQRAAEDQIPEIQNAPKKLPETDTKAESPAQESEEARLANIRATVERLMTSAERKQYERIVQSLPSGVWDLQKTDIDFCVNGFASQLLKKPLYEAATSTQVSGSPNVELYKKARILELEPEATIAAVLELRLSPDNSEKMRLGRVAARYENREMLMDNDLEWARSKWYMVNLLQKYDHRQGWKK